jgi:membrane-bound lytic murein transglycosylase D
LDERCDPVSSTNAAINYLRKLHTQFGKWYLAVMAYNCGEGRLQLAINKAGSTELTVLLDEDAKYLPKETRDYLRKILLAAMIGENALLDYEETKNDVTNSSLQVEVRSGTKLSDIAILLDMKASDLQAMNKQYKKGQLPKEKNLYKILIPEEKMMLFYMSYELEEEKKEMLKPHFISHYVALGETLESIAQEYNSSMEELMVANKLKDDALTLDMFLLIPVSKDLFETLLNK